MMKTMIEYDETHVIKSYQSLVKNKHSEVQKRWSVFVDWSHFQPFYKGWLHTKNTSWWDCHFSETKADSENNNSRNLHTKGLLWKNHTLCWIINTTICGRLKRAYFPHDPNDGGSGWLWIHTTFQLAKWESSHIIPKCWFLGEWKWKIWQNHTTEMNYSNSKTRALNYFSEF